MREVFLKIFSEGNSNLEISLFSIWHILYVLLIVGGSITAGILLRRKSEATKTKVLNILAWLIPGIYIADFFLMPFARSGHDIDIDKLPFHLCTLMGALIPFAQFNKKFEKVKTPITILGFVGALMYITYPGSAIGDISPFCYKIIQTFLYHGLLFAYGYLSIATNAIKLEFKNLYKELCFIVGLVVWASLGNTLYSNSDHHYDWFFVTGSTFGMSPWLMPFIVIVLVFAMCATIYLLNMGVRKLLTKLEKNKV